VEEGLRRAALAVGVGAYAWWAVGLPAFSAAATVAVVAAGAVAMVAGARARRRARRSGPVAVPPQPRALVWVAVLAVAGAVQLSAYLQHPREDHPTLSSLTNALLDSHPARAVAFVAWLAAARGLARR
jgi:hypothetical protein